MLVKNWLKVWLYIWNWGMEKEIGFEKVEFVEIWDIWVLLKNFCNKVKFIGWIVEYCFDWL